MHRTFGPARRVLPVLRTRWLWTLALLAAAGQAQAQTIAGRVTQEPAGTPITGAFVYLATDSGTVAVRTLTGEDGRYTLPALPGRYDLHVEFLGHQPVIVRGLLLSADEAIRRDVAMQVHAIELEGITASSESRCRNAAASGPVTQALWQEARTALRVTRWSLEQPALRYGLVKAQRRLDPVTLDVLGEEVENASRYVSGSPYVSRPAEELATHGFVTRAPGGAWDFWAPDAPVLLSDTFLENHCFRAVPPRGTEVGLAFEPVPGRHLPEIEGVLWLDVHSFELKRLDFRFVNLPYGPRTDWTHVGGRVEFERLPNGMWIVRRWRIRMPVLEAHTSSAGSLRAHDVVLTAINEVSGEVKGPDTSRSGPREEPEGGTESTAP